MKKRIDLLLVEKGYFESRERAKKAIMAGLVFVDNQRCDKAGTDIDENSKIEVKGNPIPYVSRGGLKLEKAVKNFGVELKDKVCMDIGSSTGGFTDCMLQNGATKVYSIDVGYGQLAWKLRQDERVVSMERTNIRNVTLEDLGQQADFASIPYSFSFSFKKLFSIQNTASTKPFFVPLLKNVLSYLSPKHKFSESIIIDLPEPVSPVNILSPSSKLNLNSSIRAQFFMYNSRIILSPSLATLNYENHLQHLL